MENPSPDSAPSEHRSPPEEPDLAKTVRFTVHPKGWEYTGAIKRELYRSILSHWYANFLDILCQLCTTRARFLEALAMLGFDQEVVEGISKNWELYSNAWGPAGLVEAMMGIETMQSFALPLLDGEVEWFSQVVVQQGTMQSTD